MPSTEQDSRAFIFTFQDHSTGLAFPIFVPEEMGQDFYF